MKKSTLLLILVSFIFASLLLNQSLNASQNSHEFEFARDYLESLQCLKIIAARDKEANLKIDQYESEVEMIVGCMKNLRLANTDLQMAKSYIEKYKNSENEIIREATSTILAVYNQKIEINNEGLKFYEQLYSPEMMNKPELLDQGKIMSEASKLAADKENTDRLLLYTSVMVTHTLVSQIPDKDGLMSYLAITSKEREGLIKQIDGVFGKEVEEGMKAGQTYLDACGGTIREVLTRGFKTSDERTK